MDAVNRLYLPAELGDFPAHLFAVLAALLPGTMSSIDFVDLATGQGESHVAHDPAAPGLHEQIALRRRLETHPAARVHARLLAWGVTGREVEGLHRAAEGKHDGEIAAILGISVRTVNQHVAHLFAKLGVETRTAAAAEFLR